MDSGYFDSSLLKITVIEQNTFTAAALSLWLVERMPSKPWFDWSGKTREVSWRCSRSNNYSNMLCRSRACLPLILRRNAWCSHNVGIAIFTSNPTVCLSFLFLNFSLSSSFSTSFSLSFSSPPFPSLSIFFLYLFFPFLLCLSVNVDVEYLLVPIQRFFWALEIQTPVSLDNYGHTRKNTSYAMWFCRSTKEDGLILIGASERLYSWICFGS